MSSLEVHIYSELSRLIVLVYLFVKLGEKNVILDIYSFEFKLLG